MQNIGKEKWKENFLVLAYISSLAVLYDNIVINSLIALDQ